MQSPKVLSARLTCLLATMLVTTLVTAQTPTPAAAPAAAAAPTASAKPVAPTTTPPAVDPGKPAITPARPAAPADGAKPGTVRPSGNAPKTETLEITEKRTATTERRDSSASKIIITRDDIEQYGDSNLGDVMRRLPGVTVGGRPGRGGPPAMRGMGGGFTQILINGERVSPGFSIEQITPEMVERI